VNTSAEVIDLSDELSRVGTSLNPPQLAAVTHGDGPLLVLAGAGSGKTRVLTHRIAHLITSKRARPQDILAVTFTNKAADEMKHRLKALLHDQAEGLWVSTFHSACLRILRRHGKLIGFPGDFVIYDDQDSTSLMKKVLKEQNVTDKNITPTFVLGCIDRWKNEDIEPEKAVTIKGSYNLSVAAELYGKYQYALLRAQAMDFGDLLCKTLLLFRTRPDILQLYQHHLHYILVDEFQDTNKVQYLLLKMLAEPRRNILVVGDDDQSIYSFRGAKVSTIINFDLDFPGTSVVVLDQNYRSTGTILKAANSVISENRHRKEKNLWTEGKEGDPISLFVGQDETDEAEYVARTIGEVTTDPTLSYSSIAIFYRTNAQSRALEDALITAKIPYRIFGGLKFYDRKEVKDILAYLRILINPDDSQSVLRVINTPPRGIGATAIGQLESIAGAHRMNLIQVARSVANQAKPIARFVELYDQLLAKAQFLSLSDLIREIVESSGYRARLEAIGGDESQSRIENLVELQGFSAQFDLAGENPTQTIATFLDRISLSSSADMPREDQGGPSGAVSLTTLHLAKGLEFPVVFLTGLEEGLIPHYRSLEDPPALEEERRLCYVGITRAMKKLFLTRSMQREMFSAGGGFGSSGGVRFASRFLRDIPGNLVEAVTEASVLHATRYEPVEQEHSRLWGKVSRNRTRPAQSPVGFGENRRASPGQLTASGQPHPTIRSADSFQAEDPRPLLSSEQVAIGLRVFHPTFGLGAITRIEGDVTKKPEQAKITIAFESPPVSKRLLLKYARLRVAQEDGREG
jgi:DNA helicase-2/ATP-dependent DNA helicase PcrA